MKGRSRRYAFMGVTARLGHHLQSCRNFCSSKTGPKIVAPKVCIVGSGPSGFYTAQHLIKALPDVQVDIFERLPVPFGLVRFGVAPDHPEVKNVINTFTKTARNPKVQFVGNVALGQDVTFQELQEAYHAVCLAYGADKDHLLGVPGEELGNIVSAREFVGWYNGLPQNRDFAVNLNAETVAIFGQGNVALDVARMILTPIDILKKTDITEYALSALAQSRVKRVHLIGRRGPLQVAFTIKELREMLNLEGCISQFSSQDFIGIKDVIPTLGRPRKRLTELLCKAASEDLVRAGSVEGKRYFRPVFLRAPKCFLPCETNGSIVSGVQLAVNKLEGPRLEFQRAVETGMTENLECGLVFRSIGYQSIQADPDIPFQAGKGIVKNVEGVVGPGVYAVGWLATGPVGVILSTMSNAFHVARTIATDLQQGNVGCAMNKPGFEVIEALLKSRGVQIVNFSDWERIDEVEKARGKEHGKPREKIVDIAKMLAIAAHAS